MWNKILRDFFNILFSSGVDPTTVVDEAASFITRHFAPGRLALQVRTTDGRIIVDDGFRAFFPEAAAVGGIEAVWQDLKERPEHDYSESKDWIFVEFEDSLQNIDGAHLIKRETLSDQNIKSRSGNRKVEYGRLFYYKSFDLADSTDSGPFRGATVQWFLDATEDLFAKREQRRSEVAARAIMDSLFAAGAYKPDGFAAISRPKNGEQRVGGDFFYLRRFPEDDRKPLERLCLFIGDSTGHGVGGALLSAMAGSILQRFFRSSRAWHLEPNPALRVIEYLDKEIFEALTSAAEQPADREVAPRRYTAPGAVEGCAIVIDYGYKESDRKEEPGKPMVFAAGGNIAAWMRGADSSEGKADQFQQIFKFHKGRTEKSIGYKPGQKVYQNYSSKFDRDIRIFVATDGLYNQGGDPVENEDNNLFGVDRIPSLLYQPGGSSAEGAAQQMLDHWICFKGQQQQEDDLLIVVLDVPKPGSGMSEMVGDER